MAFYKKFRLIFVIHNERLIFLFTISDFYDYPLILLYHFYTVTSKLNTAFLYIDIENGYRCLLISDLLVASIRHKYIDYSLLASLSAISFLRNKDFQTYFKNKRGKVKDLTIKLILSETLHNGSH